MLIHTCTHACTHTCMHTHTHTHTHMHTHNMYVFVSSTAYKLIAFPYSCVIYDGSQCSSVFGRANIIVPSYITAISAYIAERDILLGEQMELFSAVQDQDCLNYALFLGCLAAYRPCPGSAWCGANSKDELRSAVSSACRCNRTDSCVVDLNGFNTTAENALITIINYLPNYYVGSSSTGPVGDSNAMCQDVTGKRHNLHACSLHCVVHGGAGRVYIMIMWW